MFVSVSVIIRDDHEQHTFRFDCPDDFEVAQSEPMSRLVCPTFSDLGKNKVPTAIKERTEILDVNICRACGLLY